MTNGPLVSAITEAGAIAAHNMIANHDRTMLRRIAHCAEIKACTELLFLYDRGKTVVMAILSR